MTEVVTVSEPEVPVTVTATGADVMGALAAAVNVMVLVPLLTELNDALTPLARPEAVNETRPLKPFCAPTLMLVDEVAPCTTLTLEGEAESVKVGAGATVSETDVVVVSEPDVPVIVTVEVPVVALAPAVKVSVLVLPEKALKDAFTPLGRPEADRVTLPLKPFCWFTAIAVDAVSPCVTLTLAGKAESVKLGGAVTDTLSKDAMATAEGLFALTAKPM